MGTLVSHLLFSSSSFQSAPKRKMKFIVIAALLAMAAASPVKREALDEKKPVAILRSVSETSEDGAYYYAFESEDGTEVEDPETGLISKATVMFKEGSYTYTWEGVPYTITYTSDNRGHLAAGAHLPVAPEVPAV